MKYDVPFTRPNEIKGIVTVHANSEDEARRKALARLEEKKPAGEMWRKDIKFDRTENTVPFVIGSPTPNAEPDDYAWVNEDWLSPSGEKDEKHYDIYKRGKIHSFSFSPVSGLVAQLITGYKGKDALLEFRIKDRHAVVSYFTPYTGEEVILLDKEVHRSSCYTAGDSSIDNKVTLLLFLKQGEFAEMEFFFKELRFEVKDANMGYW